MIIIIENWRFESGAKAPDHATMTDEKKKTSSALASIFRSRSAALQNDSSESTDMIEKQETQTQPEEKIETSVPEVGSEDAQGQVTSLSQLEEDAKKVFGALWGYKDILLEFQMELRKQTGQSLKDMETQFKDLTRRIEAFHEDLALRKTPTDKIQAVKGINEGLKTSIEAINNEAQEGQTRIDVSEQFTSLINTYSDIIEKVSLLDSNLRTFFRTNKSFEERKEEKKRQSVALPGTSAIIRSQELERQRIAREIHDGPAQAIANVIFRFDIIQKMMSQKPESIPEEIAKVKDIAQGALNEIRHFIFDLRPMTLQDLGLTATLKKIIQSHSSLSDTKVELLIEGVERKLDPEVDLAIFRIAQESLSNIKKHAKADHAWVHLKYLPDKVILIVEDDGEGFDLNSKKDRTVDEYSSFGLLGMQERADDINGNLQIASQPMRGTKVIFTVPLK